LQGAGTPRLNVEDIKKDIPQDFKIADNLSVLPYPAKDKIDFIRNFAPDTATAGS